MSSYLLTWNPKNFGWDELQELCRRAHSGEAVSQTWSCGNSRSIPIGSRVFMLRQGVEPKGIVASGWVSRSPFEDRHWSADRASAGDKAFFVEFVPDVILDPQTDPVFDPRTSTSGPLTRLQVRSPASGNSIPDDVALALERAWEGHTGDAGAKLGTGDHELSALEGQKRIQMVAHRSWERALRPAKLREASARHPEKRLLCEVPGCAFDFEEVYGGIGRGFAHVHHLRPLGHDPEPTITKLSDLVVVCANCHSMIHRGGMCRDLQTLLEGHGDNGS